MRSGVDTVEGQPEALARQQFAKLRVLQSFQWVLDVQDSDSVNQELDAQISEHCLLCLLMGDCLATVWNRQTPSLFFLANFSPTFDPFSSALNYALAMCICDNVCFLAFQDIFEFDHPPRHSLGYCLIGPRQRLRSGAP